jgi:hypothetical protein
MHAAERDTLIELLRRVAANLGWNQTVAPEKQPSSNLSEITG